MRLCCQAGWTFAPSNVSFWRMISTNYQPFFVEETAMVTKELEITRAWGSSRTSTRPTLNRLLLLRILLAYVRAGIH